MITDFEITILSENTAVSEKFSAEHGLSMLLNYKGEKLLFDFGASDCFRKNASVMNIDIDSIHNAFVSHGHNDHSGGLQYFNGRIFCTSAVTQKHFSHHTGKPVRNLSMPESSLLQFNKSEIYFADTFTEIMPGIFSTGRIPRISIEDCGGPFFKDENKKFPDLIEDESALLTIDGTLIHGCCHAGLINTLEHCRKYQPDIKIHTIIGGLHLLNADEKRLKLTVEYLQKYDIKQLYLMHCTGNDAINHLKRLLNNCQIFTPHAGETFIIKQFKK